MNQFNAIPTMYNGLQFRSRLEATWAAFFDELGWRWEYEPCDFNGWIPDFVIIGKKENIWVEVKPITEFCDETTYEIECSGADGAVLLLGIGPFQEPEFAPHFFLGWVREVVSEEMSHWDFAVCGKWDADSPMGFCSASGSWQDRITGNYDGSWGCYNHEPIQEIWARAKNKTQWKPNR